MANGCGKINFLPLFKDISSHDMVSLTKLREIFENAASFTVDPEYQEHGRAVSQQDARLLAKKFYTFANTDHKRNLTKEEYEAALAKINAAIKIDCKKEQVQSVDYISNDEATNIIAQDLWQIRIHLYYPPR